MGVFSNALDWTCSGCMPCQAYATVPKVNQGIQTYCVVLTSKNTQPHVSPWEQNLSLLLKLTQGNNRGDAEYKMANSLQIASPWWLKLQWTAQCYTSCLDTVSLPTDPKIKGCRLKGSARRRHISCASVLCQKVFTWEMGQHYFAPYRHWTPYHHQKWFFFGGIFRFVSHDGVSMRGPMMPTTAVTAAPSSDDR